MPQPGREGPPLPRVLGVTDVVLLNVGTVASLRGFAATAQIGTAALPLLVLCTLLFFFPTAAMVGGLGGEYPAEGGFYVWIRHAFGERVAFLSGWIYAVTILLYFPTLLIFGASVGVHLFGGGYAGLAARSDAMVLIALSILWTVTLANVVGLDFAKWFSNVGGVATCVTLGLVVASAVIAVRHRGPASTLVWWPQWSVDTPYVWAQITYLFTGLETVGLIAGEIRDARRTVAVAAAISAGIAAVFYVAGTAALLCVLPAQDVDPLYGVVQAASVTANFAGLPWLPTLIAGMVVIKVAGQFSGVFSTTSRLPWLFGIDSYLPSWFGNLHPKFGTPYIPMILGALISTAFVVAFLGGETLRAGYDTLMDATILANTVPLLVMYAAGWKLGYRWSAALGFVVTLTAVVASLAPTSGISSILAFEGKLIGAVALIAGSGVLVYRRAARTRAAHA